MTEQSWHVAGKVPEPTPEERSRAVCVVASHAHSAQDLAELLDMLGLAPGEARRPGSAPDQLARKRMRERAGHRGHRKLSVEEMSAVLTSMGARAS